MNHFACRTCSSRKVKCDKSLPECARCVASGGKCEYAAPRPRKKRRIMGEVEGELRLKLREYERILMENRLLPSADSKTITPSEIDIEKENMLQMAYLDPEPGKAGRWVEGRRGERLFVSSPMWESLGDAGDEFHEDGEGESVDEDEKSESVDEDENVNILSAGLEVHDRKNLHLNHLHPCREDAMFLFHTHCERVEPLCKVLHIPSIARVISTAYQQHPSSKINLSHTDHALLFAIYHFATRSLTSSECSTHLLTPHSRTKLLQVYSKATLLALTHASLLQCPTLPLLQSLTLYLLSTKSITPISIFHLRTGLAVRLAQRIGLHRDGLALSLPPFEVQMRRRLWYQILPLELWATQMAGMGVSVMPETWNVEAPWNLSDGDIWEGMDMADVHRAEGGKQGGGGKATEMIFCLARATLGRAFGAVKTKTKSSTGEDGAVPTTSVEEIINQTETTLETLFLRYTDVSEPLHFLTICSVRSGLAAMRIKSLLLATKPPPPSTTTSSSSSASRTDKDREEEETHHRRRNIILTLTQKIVDIDTAASSHPSLQKLYHWYISGVFVWGSWESLIYNLTALTKDSLGKDERTAAWARISQMFQNHPEELVQSKRALHVAIRKFVRRAWRREEKERGGGGGEASWRCPLLAGVVSEVPSTTRRRVDQEGTTHLNTLQQQQQQQQQKSLSHVDDAEMLTYESDLSSLKIPPPLKTHTAEDKDVLHMDMDMKDDENDGVVEEGFDVSKQFDRFDENLNHNDGIDWEFWDRLIWDSQVPSATVLVD